MAAFCREFDSAMVRLKLALDDAAKFGLPTSNPAYVQAQAFYDSETGFWNTTFVAWGSACTDLTNQANMAAARLNDQIKQAGGGSVLSPPYRPDEQPSGGLSVIPTWAWPVIIVAGLGAVGYATNAIASAASIVVPRRRLSGVSKIRRRRRSRR